MLFATATADIWSNVFYDRSPQLNEWHLAQALVANSPLEKVVLEMLDSSYVQPYFVQLVKGYQDGGISMHTLYKGDIAHFHGELSRHLQLASALALEDSLGTEGLDSVLFALKDFEWIGNREQRLTLLLAKGNHIGARQMLDSLQLAEPENERLAVLDLMLAHYEADEDLRDASPATVAYLQSLAGGTEAGAPEAEAWLMLLGETVPEDIILPGGPKSLRKPATLREQLHNSPWLHAHPNPSNGPVYIAYQVPEGVSTVELTLTDALGRTVHSSRPQPRGGIVELNAKELSNGVHLASLTFDGIPVGTCKLTVVR